jgi:hypothetical protein
MSLELEFKADFRANLRMVQDLSKVISTCITSKLSEIKCHGMVD